MLATKKLQSKEAGRLLFRQPNAGDGPAMHMLVERCKPLDVNSRYCYLVLCEHFSSTCALAEMDGEVVGMLTAYVLPEKPNTLFVWQVAVDERMRGHGVARKLFAHLLKRDSLKDITTIEATVNPSNDASRAMFHALAREYDCTVDESPLFDASLFGKEGHEAENLIRVGPSIRHKKTLIGGP